jgi:hypothetical protein
MKINKSLILVSLICIILLPSCQSLKEGLSGQKKKSGDEFLVQKKNPLVQPENFNELPKPTETKKNKTKKVVEEDNIEDLFQIDTQETSSENSDLSILEKSILKKINKN